MGEDKTVLEGTLQKAQDAYRTISEAAELLDLPQHVLRFWEGKFPQIKPLKRGGNRRYYRPADVDTLLAIKQLLHEDGYTIRGVQKLFKEQGLRQTVRQALMGEAADDGVADEAAAAPQASSVTQAATAPGMAVLEAGQPEPLETGPAVQAPMDVEAFLAAQPSDRDRLKAVLASLKTLRAHLD